MIPHATASLPSLLASGVYRARGAARASRDPVRRAAGVGWPIADHWEPYWLQPSDEVAAEPGGRVGEAVAGDRAPARGFRRAPAAVHLLLSAGRVPAAISGRAGGDDPGGHRRRGGPHPPRWRRPAELRGPHERVHRDAGDAARTAAAVATDARSSASSTAIGRWTIRCPDGRWCGLNNEITLLRELGCYADFTMPSGNSPTQSRTVNTIYWVDRRSRRSRDLTTAGVAVRAGQAGSGDLLMIPGPFGVRWSERLIPRLETGELACQDLPYARTGWSAGWNWRRASAVGYLHQVVHARRPGAELTAAVAGGRVGQALQDASECL